MSSVAELFNKPMHKEAVPSAGLALPYAKVGVEMEVEHYTLSAIKQKKLLPRWQTHPEERSIRNKGMELTTIGGLVGQDLLTEIKLFCDVAKENKFSEGYPRAGLHLHVDVTDMNDTSNTQLLNMMLAYMLFEDALFAYAGDWRKTCGFCDAWLGSQSDWPYLAKMLMEWETFEPKLLQQGYFSKYQALNLLPIARFGTVEFRQLPMTLDYKRIIEWLNLCLCLKRFGLKQDRDPTLILATEGPDALVKAVFGEYAHIIQPFINEAELYEALPEVMGLALLKEQQPMDPWHGPDNPMLKQKKIVNEDVVLHAAPARGARKKLMARVPMQMIEGEVLERLQAEGLDL